MIMLLSFYMIIYYRFVPSIAPFNIFKMKEITKIYILFLKNKFSTIQLVNYILSLNNPSCKCTDSNERVKCLVINLQQWIHMLRIFIIINKLAERLNANWESWFYLDFCKHEWNLTPNLNIFNIFLWSFAIFTESNAL